MAEEAAGAPDKQPAQRVGFYDSEAGVWRDGMALKPGLVEDVFVHGKVDHCERPKVDHPG
ncbi:MAG: hypothetical protein HY534_06050 [Chloroflexi bacterium]|nr:hypothetical protein [Chloroflexota bacterium]